MNKEEILSVLNTPVAGLEKLLGTAYSIKVENVGKKVYFRGLIELSNICRKDCYYCGIRKSNVNTVRYMMSENEIIESAMWAFENNFGSIVLQAGEREDEKFVAFIENIVKKIKELSNGSLGITLSLGEQNEDVYKRWFSAGAHRYLLRIETSNPELYKKLHPSDHSFSRRVDCLTSLRKTGYQVGTGIMYGLPFQTLDDLVNDLLFIRELDVDMIGAGPYLVSSGTPLSEYVSDFATGKDELYFLSLKMIAAFRILLKDVNIASTTALQAMKTFGREMGLRAGANIIMPYITPMKYRTDYQLYDNKPCVDEDKELCRGCIDERLQVIDEEIGLGEWGDSPHFNTHKK